MAAINKINVNGTEYNIESIKESYKGINTKTVQADGDEYYICTFNEYIEDSGLLAKVNIYSEPLTAISRGIEVIDYSIIQTLGDQKGSPDRINVDKTTSDCDIERVVENSGATSGEVYRWYFRFPLSQNYPGTGSRWRSVHGTIKFRVRD